MKQISETQIKEIMALLMELNIPVKPYVSLQELFSKLPIVEVKNEDKSK
jgi:hypothetical protein